MNRNALSVGHIGTTPELCSFCGSEFRAEAGFSLVEILDAGISPVCRPCGQTLDPNAVEMLDRVIQAAGSYIPDPVVELIQRERERTVISR